jgi:hypothetical protein
MTAVATRLNAPPRIRRHRRRRRRRYRGDRIDLPIGARVYAPIEWQERDPDGRRRLQYGWCEIVELPKSRRSALITLRPESLLAGAQSDVRADLRACAIRSAAGNWMVLSRARDRWHPVYWWWHDVEIRSFRRATELEVAFYSQGFVPHEGWRLMDGGGQDFIELNLAERVWLAKPEPPTDEEIADAREKAKTKKRVGELVHAKRMLDMWERDQARAAKRVSKWKAAVKRLEKPKTRVTQ